MDPGGPRFSVSQRILHLMENNYITLVLLDDPGFSNLLLSLSS